MEKYTVYISIKTAAQNTLLIMNQDFSYLLIFLFSFNSTFKRNDQVPKAIDLLVCLCLKSNNSPPNVMLFFI